MPVSEFESPTIDPQPIYVNNNELSPEFLSHKEGEENQAQHRYNLQTRRKLANVAVSPVHNQPSRLHPSLTSTTIPPIVTRLRARVAISNYDIDPSHIPSIWVQIPQGKYTQGYGAANHALQLWKLEATVHDNFPDEGFSGVIINDETRKSLAFRNFINMDKYRDLWMKKISNEIDWLAQEIRDLTVTDKIDFILHTDVPVRTTVTYGQIVCMW